MKDVIENGLKRWGAYDLVHRPYYLMKHIFIRLLRPRTPLTIHNHTALFWTPNPILYRRVHELRGEEKLLDQLLSLTQEGDIFWDVGANIGIYSLLLSSAVGKQGTVYSFEPEPQSCTWLNQNRALNRAKNIQIMPMALGATETEITLFPAKRAGMGIHKLFDDGQVQSQGVQVPLIPGDILIERGRAHPPTLLKIDVEGYEMSVLQGLAAALKSSTCRLLALEVHPQELAHFQYQVSDVRTFITQQGFTIEHESHRDGQLHWLCMKETTHQP